jgi:hypothetical protein
MMPAVVAPDASVSGSPPSRAASSSGRFVSRPATPKSRGVPARFKPSTMTSATVLRLTPTGARPTSFPGEALEHRPHALERQAQIGLRVRVREPEISLTVSAERRARQRGHAGLGQEPLGDLG